MIFFNKRVYFSDKFNINYEKNFCFVLQMKKYYSACRKLSSKKRHASCLYCRHFGKKIFFVRLIICIINPRNFILVVLLHYEKKIAKNVYFSRIQIGVTL